MRGFSSFWNVWAQGLLSRLGSSPSSEVFMGNLKKKTFQSPNKLASFCFPKSWTIRMCLHARPASANKPAASPCRSQVEWVLLGWTDARLSRGRAFPRTWLPTLRPGGCGKASWLPGAWGAERPLHGRCIAVTAQGSIHCLSSRRLYRAISHPDPSVLNLRL